MGQLLGMLGLGGEAGAAAGGGAAAAAPAAAVPAGLGAASMSAPGYGAGMSTVGGGSIVGPANAAAPGMLSQVGSGLGQGMQGFGQGLFGLPVGGPGQAMNVGHILGGLAQQSMNPQEQGTMNAVGNIFSRPSQGMDPNLLQKIGMMILGMGQR